ncbi:MAG TPA: hypothetical protein VF498_18590 [Anaerolineales bacterium]
MLGQGVEVGKEVLIAVFTAVLVGDGTGRFEPDGDGEGVAIAAPD